MTRLPAVLTVAAGAAVSLQVFLNGRLGVHLGSFEIAGAVNNVTGATALCLAAVATGVPRRAIEEVRTKRRPPVWHMIAGANGALFVLVTTAAVPKIGVALVTVAVVFGQSTGSLAMDALGLGPSGHHPLSPPRLIGAVLALTAVGLGAFGTEANPDFVLLGLAALAVLGVAVQSAAMGHMGAFTGEPLAAAALNVTVGATVLVIVAATITGGIPPHGWSAPPQVWLGGVIGAGVAVVLTRSVRKLGVLRLVLAMVAGQSIGALTLDLLAPVPGRAVTAQTVLSVGLSLLALVISGQTWGAAKKPVTAGA